MDSFVCKRCGHATDRNSFLYWIHGVSPHYCDRCFAEDRSGKRGFLGWFLMINILGAYLLASVAMLGVTAGVALTLLGAEWFTESSPLLRGSILLVPGLVLGAVLWRRRAT